MYFEYLGNVFSSFLIIFTQMLFIFLILWKTHKENFWREAQRYFFGEKNIFKGEEIVF